MNTNAHLTIDCKGVKSGIHDYRFTAGVELFEAEQSEEIKGGEFDIKVQLRRSGSFAELDAAIEGYAIVECDRCLEDCRLPVECSNSLTVRFIDGEPDYDGEVMTVPAAESEIDLAHFIYESIVLALPYRRVHPDGECNPEMVARISGVDDGSEEADNDVDREE